MSSYLIFFESDNTYAIRNKGAIKKIKKINGEEFVQVGYGKHLLTGQIVCTGSRTEKASFMRLNQLTPSCCDENDENEETTSKDYYFFKFYHERES